MPFAHRLRREERLEQLRLVLRSDARPIVDDLETNVLASIEEADRIRPLLRPAAWIACWALMTKFSVTCSSSVKFANTLPGRRRFDLQRDRSGVEMRRRSWRPRR